MHEVPWLYRNFHSHHHRLYVPYAFGALYNHWLEGLVLDSLGAALAEMATGMTVRQTVLLFGFASAKTVDDHSGYRLWWDPLQVRCIPQTWSPPCIRLTRRLRSACARCSSQTMPTITIYTTSRSASRATFRASVGSLRFAGVSPAADAILPSFSQATLLHKVGLGVQHDHDARAGCQPSAAGRSDGRGRN